MSKEFNIKAMINKVNGQISASFPKKQMPKAFIDLIKKDPSMIRKLRIKLEGFE